MKYIAVAVSLLFSLSVAHGTRAAMPKIPPAQTQSSESPRTERNFSIQVAAGDWGNVSPSEVESLLNRIAAEMLAHFPGRRLAPIEVFPTENAPVVLYQKGPENQYQVYLTAKGRRWGEYIYEFSHELFHILSNYEYHAPPRKAPHLWFEEMMCEAASLYSLKRFSSEWEASVPRTEWAVYAPALNRFKQRALNEPHRQLPHDTSLSQWFQEHRDSLLGNPYLRAKNEMVAMLFLPALELNSDWRAVGFLNRPEIQTPMNFHEYLANWYRNTPVAHRNFVVHSMNLFEFHIPDTPNQVKVRPQYRRETATHVDAGSDMDDSARDAGASGTSRQ